MHSLPLFHRVAGRTVIVLGEGAAAEAKRRLVERAGGIVADESETAARLAFVALDEPHAAEAAADRLRGRGLLVNVVDRPELCDFVVPSVLERDPVLIAVGTGGASAGLAKALRLRLEGLLPASLGRLATALGQARAALREAWPDPTSRRRALDAALAAGGPLDPLGEDTAGRVAGWLAGSSRAAFADEVSELVLRSDDPDDLTVREARLLGAADVIRCDRDVPEAILARARADALRRPLDNSGDAAGLVVVIRR